MIKNSFYGICLAALLAAGCTTTVDPYAPVRYGESVQVVSYDSTPRPFNPNVIVYSTPAALQGRPYHAIADLYREGWPNDQALLMNALIWRAKSLGADGVVLLPPTLGNFVDIPFGRVGRQFNYRAQAFTWYNSPPPAPSTAPSAPTPPTAPPSAR
jgi:hypothetical protein